MTTPLYVLCPEGQNILFPPAPVWQARRVTVQTDWYAARGKALRHAAANGAETAFIAVNHVNLCMRPHWNGLGPETELALLNVNGMHGLWLYLGRLLRRFAHVYVPHRSAMRSWRSLKKYPWRYINNPVLPLVAGYRVKPLLAMDLDMPFGYDLCRAGYDSLTVSDYFYDPVGPIVFDEIGSANSWDAAYRKAQGELL